MVGALVELAVVLGLRVEDDVLEEGDAVLLLSIRF